MDRPYPPASNEGDEHCLLDQAPTQTARRHRSLHIAVPRSESRPPQYRCGNTGQALEASERYRRCFQRDRSEEHTSELQSLMRISYAVFCLKKKIQNTALHTNTMPTHKISKK